MVVHKNKKPPPNGSCWWQLRQTRNGDDVREVRLDFTLKPILRVAVLVSISDGVGSVGCVMIFLYRVIIIRAHIDWLAVIVDLETGASEADTTVVSVTSLLHAVKVEATEEKGRLAFATCDGMGQQDIQHVIISRLI